MKFNDGLKLASRDLSRRKLRTFLTSLAIAVGIMLIVTLVSLGTSGENLILSKFQNNASLKKVTVINMKYFDMENTDFSELDMDSMYKKIDATAIQKFSNISGVTEIKATITNPIKSIKIDNTESKNDTKIVGLYNNNSIFSNDSIQSVRKDNNNNNLNPIVAGRNLNNSDKNSILIGKNYLNSMGIKDYKSIIGKDITIIENKTENPNITISPLEVKVKVIGIINDKFETKDTLVTSIDVANKIKSYYSLQENYIDNIGYEAVDLHSKDMNDISHISNSIKSLGYYSSSYQEMVDQIKNSFKIIKVILAVLGLIVLFVASVGTINTMIMVIYERTKSIGIMKSIGANRNNIHSIFLMQSGIIGFIGGIFGLIFSVININIIQLALKLFLQSKDIKETINFAIPSWLLLGALAFSILISIIAGIYPSIKASKMDPVKALNS
ncbi:MacB-like periplasmic core domain/FtsX-like permease family [Clostridium pasteurianum DSM 525 = ATCC 6013]|uniref:MacB-like periplasmic core domain containing protein n=1 Tax=Clostridium pasteurianum DSM 525 = ATCC 6013 TaxID=1262449 RepID=A0A0H3J0G9_CLOPA|nr:ABC transporter permease [Clostridium pasteurianum]AJA46157.1 MacB-like periplasmic core domain/FtsX-like permease family [Clostridium pasteurianum DSM 525 = ATCC 6013]AJA50145.1 MacB-like periplasmic core domain/FtsX-like permease family [Clostridium pasteurianum DSM 525 = ATCC 6013]AOZ73617.1 ABC transporter permease [Clostridium pasteurianum DSM 525 = ATCC 6013]AOZ77414.1 ABC transporter permease [Clostridium pasteurianum]ELP57740.1 permease [Clostridium pasteurianum DSM 525 = ATCC 6013]